MLRGRKVENNKNKSGDEIVHFVEFNPLYLEIFNKYKTEILKLLPEAKIELIGSAAVPMKGKRELDILVESSNKENAQKKLIKNGYEEGPVFEDTSYVKDFRYGIECEVHIMNKGDKKINEIKFLISKLKKDKKLRDKFEKFKESCESLDIREYRKRKAIFLKSNFNISY